MSKKRLKAYYHEYLNYVARGKTLGNFFLGIDYGMWNAYGYALGYSDIKMESDLKEARRLLNDS